VIDVTSRTSSPGKFLHRLIARAQRSDRGDTLIEILVAIVIISITVVALLGVLTTSVTSTAEFRTFATVDTVLKSVADAVKYDFQAQPPGVARYTNCSSSYQIVTEYPTSVAPGSRVTVFGTDFQAGPATVMVGTTPVATTVSAPTSGTPSYTGGTIAGNVLTVSNGGFTFTPTDDNTVITETDGQDLIPSGTTLTYINATSAQLSGPVTAGTGITFTLPDRYGNLSATFVAPASGTYPISVTDGPGPSVSSSTPLTVSPPTVPPAATTASAADGYTVGISAIDWWNDSQSPTSGFTDSAYNSPPSSCSADDHSGTQMVTLQATAPNKVTNTLSVVVSDQSTGAPPGPSISVNAPTFVPPGAVPVTVTLSGFSGDPAPTGSVVWTITVGLTNATCPTSTSPSSTNGSTSTWTCAATLGAGTYQITASYSGDSHYGPATGSTSTLITPFAISNVMLNGPTPNQIAPGDTIVITFDAAVNPNSFCPNSSQTPAWPQTNGAPNAFTGPKSLVTVSSLFGSDDMITISRSGATSCPVFNFGNIDLGSSAYLGATPSVTFGGGASPSTGATSISWNVALTVLTITLGQQTPSSPALPQNVAPSSPVFNYPTTLTDFDGDFIQQPPYPANPAPPGAQF